MDKHHSIAFYRTGKYIVDHLTLILCLSILFITAVGTFALQNKVVGFVKGYDELAPKHHGSVSSRGLAIISQATAENGFVGYAIRIKDEQNQVHYDYFDRYPVFFSAIFNRVLALREKLSSKIYLARQVMNLIFVATLFVAFLLLDKLIRNQLLALMVVLVSFANPYLMFYKDMVHFDQPALFGFLLITYAIALYKIDGLKWPVIGATFAAIAMGRGYASYAVLGLWLVIEAYLILRTRNFPLGKKIQMVVKHPAFILMVVAIIWGASLLSYNLIIEARQRNVSILETSILDSAVRRLSFSPDFNEKNESIINWIGYAQTEISRIIKWSSPVKWPNPSWEISAILLVGMFGIMALAIRTQPLEKRIIFILLAFAGFIWMTLMRNLAAFHDYTTMYFIGVPLAFFASLAILLKPSKDAAYYLALMGLVIFLSGLVQVRDLHESIAGNANDYTHDFMRIEEAIGGKGNNVYLEVKIPYSTNAEEFYLSDQYLAPLSISDYVITENTGYPGVNLTPGNRVVYLFRKK
jgi:hypothetical protein